MKNNKLHIKCFIVSAHTTTSCHPGKYAVFIRDPGQASLVCASLNRDQDRIQTHWIPAFSGMTMGVSSHEERLLINVFRCKLAANILEVGCGIGGNLELLVSHGQLSSMELNDKAHRLVNQKIFVMLRRLANNIPFLESFDRLLAQKIKEVRRR